MRQSTLALLVTAIVLTMAPAQAQVVRNFTSRYSVNTNGDIVLIGNTLMTCSTTGTNGASCNAARNGTGSLLNNNSFTMVYVDMDGDSTTTNSSSADLNLPPGSTVLWAGLYWGAEAPSLPSPNTVRFRTPTTGYITLTATQTDSISVATERIRYQGFVEVTSLVQSGGNGTYWVADVKGSPNNSDRYAGWALVVVYRNSSQPLRHLNVFDGYASVAGRTTVSTTISGFLTPATGPVTLRLGTVAYEGDLGLVGDRLQVNGTDLSDPTNPATNFFNSTISDLGVHVVTKNPNYINQLGFDIDRTENTDLIGNAQTSATVSFVTTGDAYLPGVLTFAINIYAPDLTSTFTKSVADLNGGNVLIGDILEYTVSFTNTGQDGATNVVVRDPIPAGTQYVPGSLQVVGNAPGAPTGTFTDASGDDIAEYSPSCTELPGSPPCVRFRLGTGASASQGGLIMPSQGATVRFRVQVLSSAAGQTISNTAQVSYNAQTLGTAFSQTASANVSVSVPTPPSLSKSFSPTGIPPNDVSSLTITLTNPNPHPATLTADLVDQLPNGLVVVNPANAFTTCTGGALTADAGSGTITLSSGAQIPASGACTITVSVTSGVAGAYTNSLPAGTLQTDLGSNQTAASATLYVVGYAVEGFVYHDLEPNGLRGPAEDWQTGATVWVKLVQGGVVKAVVQVDPGTGAFQFQGVSPGTYTLLVDDNSSLADTTPTPPPGWLFVNPPTGSLSLTVSGNTTGLLFGLFHGAVVEGRVFWDDGLGGGTANDAWQDGGEAGVGNVEVRATDGTNTRLTLTDGTGYYRLYIPASWGGVTLSHPLRPATGWNDGTTANPVDSWASAQSPASPGATVSLGSGSSIAGQTLTRNFGVVRESRFYPDATGQTSSPGTYTFAHWYRPGSLGQVTLSLNPPNPRYTYQVRVDGNCDGTFGPGEEWGPFPYTFSVGSTWPREPDGSLRACAVEVRALVPAGEPTGATDIALVKAELAWANRPGVVEPDSLTDTLQVAGGEVRLEKRVRNVTQNTPFATTGQGKPGEVLEYCIAYRNLGTQGVNAFWLTDPVPYFTDPLLSVADYGGRAIRWAHGGNTSYLTAASDGDPGEVVSGVVRVQVGVVGPGEMGEVCYRVQVR